MPQRTTYGRSGAGSSEPIEPPRGPGSEALWPAEIDARRIRVTAQDGTVDLSGNVHAWVEREEAERAAWAAPGVRDVRTHIALVP